MIHYLQGDATCPQAKGPKIIAHVCNNRGGWGKGFVLALSKRWDEPEQYYRRWYASGEGFELGATQLVQVLPDTWVANMVAQFGYKTGSKGPPIRYDALKKCLQKVATEAATLKASVHAPRLGCGLAGGTWDKVCPVLEETFPNRDVYIYDLV